MGHIEIKWANAVEKIVQRTCWEAGLPQNINL